MKRIGLFGGSFDPVHKAHIDVALFCLKELELDEVQFIPTKNNPWKDHSVASTKQRLEMLHIALKDFPQFKVNTIEIENSSNKKNYTIDTLDDLIDKNNNDQYFFIMGMDQANHFHLWKDANKISEKVQLVAFSRGGVPLEKSQKEKYHFIYLNNKPITASSSDVREGQISLLNREVLKYITSKGIYIDTMIRPLMREKRYKHSLSVAALAKEIADANGLDGQKAYIAGILHDVAKEMENDELTAYMEKYYPDRMYQPFPVWHQYISKVVAEGEFLVSDLEVLSAIETHTTGSIFMNQIGKCVYVADKYDPLRLYDSSKEIELCKKNINRGFKQCLMDFYKYSQSQNKKLDNDFYEIYDYFINEGEKNE